MYALEGCIGITRRVKSRICIRCDEQALAALAGPCERKDVSKVTVDAYGDCKECEQYSCFAFIKPPFRPGKWRVLHKRTLCFPPVLFERLRRVGHLDKPAKRLIVGDLSTTEGTKLFPPENLHAIREFIFTHTSYLMSINRGRIKYGKNSSVPKTYGGVLNTTEPNLDEVVIESKPNGNAIEQIVSTNPLATLGKRNMSGPCPSNFGQCANNIDNVLCATRKRYRKDRGYIKFEEKTDWVKCKSCATHIVNYFKENMKTVDYTNFPSSWNENRQERALVQFMEMEDSMKTRENATVFVKKEATDLKKEKSRMVVDNGLAKTYADHPVLEVVEKLWVSTFGHHTIKNRLSADVLDEICETLDNTTYGGCTDGSNFDMTIGENYKSLVENMILLEAYSLVLGSLGYSLVRDKSLDFRCAPKTKLRFEKIGKPGEDKDILLVTIDNSIRLSGDRGTSVLNAIANYFFHMVAFADVTTISFSRPNQSGECSWLTDGEPFYLWVEGDDSVYCTEGRYKVEKVKHTFDCLGINATMDGRDNLGFIGNIIRLTTQGHFWVPDIRRAINGHGRSSVMRTDPSFHEIAAAKYAAAAIRFCRVPYMFEYFVRLHLSHYTPTMKLKPDNETFRKLQYSLGLNMEIGIANHLQAAMETYHSVDHTPYYEILDMEMPEYKILMSYEPAQDDEVYSAGALMIHNLMGSKEKKEEGEKSKKKKTTRETWIDLAVARQTVVPDVTEILKIEDKTPIENTLMQRFKNLRVYSNLLGSRYSLDAPVGY